MKSCLASFLAGVLATVVVVGMFVGKPEPPLVQPSPPPAPVVISPDYARVTSLIEALEDRLSQLTEARSRLPIEEPQQADVTDASPAPRVFVTQSSPTKFAYVAPPGVTLQKAEIQAIPPAAPTLHATTPPRRVAENGSYYGQRNANGVRKTVFVRGYYRQDGTYVRGHYRSAPGSNR